MQSNLKKAIVIGETNLCIKCAEYLVNNKWKIIFIVSDDQIVIDWAKNNSIPTLPTYKLSTIKESDFYLFSIINPCLIPKSFLLDKGILLALNYHDSPLPKYAGINSTTWAIINNENTHGVTLHQITAGIDDGDIAAQSIIRIEKDDTAISLNLKCSEQLLLLFKDVIAKIDTNTLTFSKQNLNNRTYYGSKYIPTNYGIVNGIENLETLHRLIRGLTFGVGYDNQVATVKVFLNGQLYIAEDFNTELTRDDYTPDSNTVLFNTVRDIYGNKTDLKIAYQDITTDNKLTNDDLQYLSDIKTFERRNKRQILEFLNNSDASTKILDHILHESDDEKCIQELIIPDNINATRALTLVYLVLVRFFHDSDFIISLYTNDDSSIPDGLCGLVENRNFIHAHSDMLSHGFTYLENYLAQLQKNCHTITKDFGYRYGLQLLTDIAITAGKVECIDKHKIIIRIEGKKLVIEGIAAYQLQTESIVASARTMFAKDIQEEIATKDLKHISILDQDQYQQIVYAFNQTEKDYPKDKTIHQLFEEQVLKTPNNIAVVYEDTKLTYQELNNKANQLANYLRQNYDIKPDDLVALCLDRSEQMLIAMLGVLKSGAAYVPIDPSYPSERIGYILDDTKTRVVLANDVYINRLQQLIKQKIDVIAIDSKETQIKLTKQKNINLITSTVSNNLMYVIYTSGTTGNPKGVLIGHHSVANYITYLINYNDLNGKSIGSQYAGFGFDASVCEIYPILLTGGALHIVPEQDKSDPIKVNDFFCKNGITRAFLPTKFAELFFNLKNTSLIDLLVAGEKLEKFTKQPYRISNGYGPTESTVHTTNFVIDRQYKNIPIGKPINNIKCYVVDNGVNLLPIGAIGELMIGGECLARGYLNHPDLTAEKFISNPFQTEEEKSQNKNSRLYKTGDLVRWLPDGNLEYIGRNDFQVKIRGYRIELGEIENKISSYPSIKQAVVIAKERSSKQPGDKYLLAYYVSDKKLDEEKLKAYLTTRLPEYMIPQALVHINKLPLTANGKIDKKALPEPKLISQSEYVLPRNDLEKNICKMYAQILNLPVEQVGIKSDFFKMGGDSISSIQLVYRIRQKLSLNISVTDIFTHRNVEQLVKNVLTNQNTQENKICIKQEDNPIGKSDFLPIQEWFFDNIRNGSYKKHNHWNQSFIIKTPELDTEILKLSIEKLLQHHDAFRFRYKNFEKSYAKVDLAKESENIKYIDISNLTDIEIKNKLIEIQSSFNIETAPIHAIAYLHGYKDKTARLFFAMHHLIVDSVSWRILTHDISRLYELLQDQRNADKTSQDLLGRKGTSYRQWVEEVKNYEPSQQELNYWDDVLKDHIHIPKSTNKESYDEFSLTSQLTQKLLTKANEAYNTQINDILLSAISRALAQAFDRQINHITLEGHGREEINPEIDVTKTMGWFTTMYPVKLVNQPTVSSLIKTTKENLRNIPNKGIGYGSIKGYRNLPNISFNYLGQLSGTEDFWTIIDHIISMDPQNQSSNILDVYGYVVNGTLKFHVSCNSFLFDAKAFVDKFKLNLEELIDHCTANNEITEEDCQNMGMSTLLHQVKLNYARKANENQVDEQLQNKIDYYLKNANSPQQDLFLQKPITNVLLTGSTGFLGCNLLNQLLKLTNYNVFLLVRADSQVSAIDRINKKFQFYFDKTLDDVYEKRVFVLESDITANSLGLSEREYKDLSAKIDSIIHAAALVKHYGDYNNFYLQNVQSTVNLLEFAKLTKLKDFHYISTRSVLDNSCDSVCTEDDMPSDAEQDNVYLKTKLQGEYQAIKYRDYGIKSNIYRVGNLAFMVENYRTQENIEENAFFNWFKCLFKLRCVAKEISNVEISPVDLTAEAIVKLFDKNGLSNKTHHVFNPCLFNMSESVSENSEYKIETLSVDKFIDRIIDEMRRGIDDSLIMKFLLYQGWMDSSYIKSINVINILQDRTQRILKHLGFVWTPTTIKAFFNRYYKLLCREK